MVEGFFPKKDHGLIELQNMIHEQRMPRATRDAGEEVECAIDVIENVTSWTGVSLEEVGEIIESAPDIYEGSPGIRSDKPYYAAALNILKDT